MPFSSSYNDADRSSNIVTAARRRLPLLYLYAFLLSWFAAGRVVAQDRTTDLSVVVSAVSSTVTEGEPILLRLALTNQTHQTLTLQPGPGGDEWYTVTLRDASGRVVPNGVKDRPPYLSATFSTDAPIPASGSHIEMLAIRPQEGSVQPGKYTVMISVQMPYYLSQHPGLVPGEPVSQVVLTQQYVIPIAVATADHSRMQAMAKSLANGVAGRRRTDQTISELRALLALPEADALPAWRVLAHDTALDVLVRQELPRLLFQAHSAGACDILLDMSQDVNQGLIVQNLADLYLDRLYRDGDTALKQHIEASFENRGLTLPLAPLISID